MSNSRMMRYLSVVMIVAMSAAPVLADVQAGMLQTRGTVLQNGSKVAGSAAVFAGDTLQTAEDSAFAITASGSTVLVPAKSSVVFGANSIEVLCGGALISTSKGMSAQVNNLSVAPASQSARYEVVQTADRLQVVAREGELAVNDGARTLTLQAGNSIEASGGCFKAAAQNAAARTAAPAPQMGNSFLGGDTLTTILVLGISAAVITGIVIAAQEDEDESPFN